MADDLAQLLPRHPVLPRQRPHYRPRPTPLFAAIGAAAAASHSGPLTAPAALDHRSSRHLRRRLHPVLGTPHRPSSPSGPLGRLMWRSHAAHHLPEQVYVLMHPASHPIYTLPHPGARDYPAALSARPHARGGDPRHSRHRRAGHHLALQSRSARRLVQLRLRRPGAASLSPQRRPQGSAATMPSSCRSSTSCSAPSSTGRAACPSASVSPTPTEYPRSVEVWKIMLLPFHPRHRSSPRVISSCAARPMVPHICAVFGSVGRTRPCSPNFARAGGTLVVACAAARRLRQGQLHNVGKISVDWTGNDIAIEAVEDPGREGRRLPRRLLQPQPHRPPAAGQLVRGPVLFGDRLRGVGPGHHRQHRTSIRAARKSSSSSAA